MTNSNTNVSGIYKITNTINGDFYIGSAVNIRKRWNRHRWNLNKNRHNSPYLQNAWNKYGVDAFEFSIIETCFVFALILREQYYIDTLKPKYNISQTAGSSLGVKHTEATRSKISVGMTGNKNSLGKKLSLEHRNKIRESLWGVTKSPKQIEAIRKSMTPKVRRKIGDATKRQNRKPETYEKIAAANRGRRHTPEARAKMSISQKGNKKWLGRKHSEETKEKMSLAMILRWIKKKQNT